MGLEKHCSAIESRLADESSRSAAELNQLLQLVRNFQFHRGSNRIRTTLNKMTDVESTVAGETSELGMKEHPTYNDKFKCQQEITMDLEVEQGTDLDQKCINCPEHDSGQIDKKAQKEFEKVSMIAEAVVEEFKSGLKSVVMMSAHSTPKSYLPV